jgi:hypothetical protein
VADDPGQLDSLIAKYGRDKQCLCAAELDLQELNAARVQIEERIAHAEREFKHWQSRTEASYSAVRRRIDAQTDSAMATEATQARCKKLLTLPADRLQYIKLPSFCARSSPAAA